MTFVDFRRDSTMLKRAWHCARCSVSSQRLKVVSDILADYQSYEAMVASAESYGGINSKDVYLNPGRAVTFGT
ncbi:MAG: hypothetical protein IJV19_04425, partial [Prevotella sp.]|nr:hypothetical protein [Prevotella sp.]